MKLVDVNDVKAALLGWDTDPKDEEIEFAIDRISAVDAVEVVYGQWNLIDFAGNVRCSACRKISDEEYSFCPNCGAYMRGGRQ